MGDRFKILTGDCIEHMGRMDGESIDLIFADPPYFLSGKGTTCSGGKRVSVKKGDWDAEASEFYKNQFTGRWLNQCYRILKETGTIWASGTHHNIHKVGDMMTDIGFEILNDVIWVKKAPPPNLGCRTPTHSHELIIWARKRGCKHYFDYDASRAPTGKQMLDVWTDIGRPKKVEYEHGKHATQKPVELLDRIISISAPPGGQVLDPFQGHGTTGVACSTRDLCYTGIDLCPEMNNVARLRLGLKTV